MKFSQVLHQRLDTVTARIKKSCDSHGRNFSEVKLMAVSKHHPPATVAQAVAAGLSLLGENRVQEAAAKRPALQLSARWELIGHLQRNKARQAVETFERIQTVDNAKLIAQLVKVLREMPHKAPYPVLLQVNAGRDPGKFGCQLEEAHGLVELLLQQPVLQLEGLMTIAPLDAPGELARPCFANLRRLKEQLEPAFGIALPELSMGMTGDLEAAIAEGSTLVRVGTALFGERTVEAG